MDNEEEEEEEKEEGAEEEREERCESAICVSLGIDRFSGMTDEEEEEWEEEAVEKLEELFEKLWTLLFFPVSMTTLLSRVPEASSPLRNLVSVCCCCFHG